MAGINRATYLEPHEDKAVNQIAKQRKWSLSRTIAELVRESKTFKQFIKANKPEPRGASV